MGCGGSKVDTTAQRDQQGANGTIETKGTRGAQGRRTQRGGQTEGGSSETPRRRRGQPVNEKGYKKRIRENLRNATAGDDIDVLDKNMETFRNNHLEDGGDYADAEERMDFLKTRKDIRDACMRRHPKVLEDSIRRVEASKYKRQLKPYLDRAYYLKQHSEDPTKFKHDISGLDQTTISEIRHYNHPPPGVHETMIATYMILGYPEEHLTKDWTEVTALMGRYGNHSLLREVEQAEGKQVDKNVALRARNYLGTHSLEKIREKSNGAAAFHVWASRMVGKHESKKSEGNIKPLSNTGGKGQQPGQRGNPTTPKTPSTPSKVQKDSVKNKKQVKEQENKAKQQQQQQTNQMAKRASIRDNKQALSNSQNAKNARQNTTQKMNAVGNKSTKKG